LRNEGAAFERGGFAEGEFGDVGGDASQRKIFAERVIGVAFPHVEAAEVGMIGKTDSREVVDFALEPVGSGVDVGDGWEFWEFWECWGNWGGFDAELCGVFGTVEFVGDVETRVAIKVVGRGDVEEEFEAEHFFAVKADFAKVLRSDRDGRFAAEFGLFQCVLLEKF